MPQNPAMMAATIALVVSVPLGLLARDVRRIVVTAGTMAVRERANATTTVVVSAESLEKLPGARSLDQLIATLPQDRKVSMGSLPQGWTGEQRGRQIRLSGPPLDRVYARFDLNGNYTKDYAGKQARLQSGAGGTLDEPLQITLPVLPRVEATPYLEGILTVPPSAVSGQPVLIGVAAPYRIGNWRVAADGGNVPLLPLESLRDTIVVTPDIPSALVGLRGTPRLDALIGRPEPRSFITALPATGGTPRILFTDRWGELTVDAPLPIVFVPSDSTPLAVHAASPFVLAGQAACVRGSFPDLDEPYRLVLDGTTPLAPWGASRTNVMVGIPDTVAPGPHTIGVSGGSTTVTVGVLQLDASIDQNELWRGQSTTLRLRVTGSDRPISIAVLNRTPAIIAIDGGAHQTVTTSGGADNSVSKSVKGTQRGEFSIDVRVHAPGCGS